MTTWKLSNIIETNETGGEIPFEEITKRKKQVYSYYRDKYGGEEPVIMVTFICNAIQGCKIVPVLDFENAVLNYIEEQTGDEEEKEHLLEEINFNSKMLKDVL